MPRKGWSTVQVPDGLLKGIRGPRPPATKWPRVQHPAQLHGGRRDTQLVRNQQQVRERAPVDLDTAMANARARMSKLEAAMSVVSEEDRFIQGCWRRSRRPAPRHRRNQCETASQGQSSFCDSSGGKSSEGFASGGGWVRPREPTSHGSSQFRTGVGAVGRCRVGVAEERDELRMELAGRPQEDARPGKTNKSLSSPSLDLVPVRSQVGVSAQESGRDLSTIIETLIDQAESAARSGQSTTLSERTRCTFRASCESHQ